jgi:plasmid stabilization system protein ParE
MKIIVFKRARRQLERAATWWSENRPLAPTLFVDELARAERLLLQYPEAGAIYSSHRNGIIRRVLLGDTRHHLYYRYWAGSKELFILSVWSALRREGPKL